jgi:hypothetical protein
MLGGLKYLRYGCSQVTFPISKSVTSRCSISNSPNYAHVYLGVTFFFSFHAIQVLVVQASEAPHNSISTIRAAEPAGRSSQDATVKNVIDNSAILSSKAASGATYKAREIVAYDDLF